MSLKVGSKGALVNAWVHAMNARFPSYSRRPDGTPLREDGQFGNDDAAVQREYQRRIGVMQTGEVSEHDLLVLGVDKRPLLITVCGTGVPWWVGPDADTARAVEDKYRWQPIGYPAQPFPMGPSVAAGRAEVAVQINRDEPEFKHRERIQLYGLALAGYSQGAIITGEVWEYDMKPASGPLHWVQPRMLKAVTWGNPMREADKAYPDPGAAIANKGSHGIADQLMVDTPPWWRNYAHHKDIYTEQSGESGEDSTAIYKMIMGVRVFSGPDSILHQLVELGLNPFSGAGAAAWALLNAGMFFGGGTGPHLNYNIGPAIDYLRS